MLFLFGDALVGVTVMIVVVPVWLLCLRLLLAISRVVMCCRGCCFLLMMLLFLLPLHLLRWNCCFISSVGHSHILIVVPFLFLQSPTIFTFLWQSLVIIHCAIIILCLLGIFQVIDLMSQSSFIVPDCIFWFWGHWFYMFVLSFLAFGVDVSHLMFESGPTSECSMLSIYAPAPLSLPMS